MVDVGVRRPWKTKLNFTMYPDDTIQYFAQATLYDKDGNSLGTHSKMIEKTP